MIITGDGSFSGTAVTIDNQPIQFDALTWIRADGKFKIICVIGRLARTAEVCDINIGVRAGILSRDGVPENANVWRRHKGVKQVIPGVEFIQYEVSADIPRGRIEIKRRTEDNAVVSEVLSCV